MSSDRDTHVVLTQCPACRTLFRLSEEERVACGGTVRCGHCGHVFQADVYRLGETDTKAPAGARRRPQPLLWGLANGLLVLGLLAQAAYWWRAQVVAIAPWHVRAERIVRHLGWTLPRPVDVGAFALRALHVSRGAKPGVLHIRGQLANDAGFPQTPPLLAVSLLDAEGDLLVRRLYRPQAYLVAGTTGDVSAHTRVDVRLDLRGPPTATAFRLGLYARGGTARPPVGPHAPE
ncbi:MAG: zinc-ribbon and DUF3426 domain-containing protein [Gammaproteobacteria bacterium]|nr:zinc-ribbon and DUF3426 domain-containing protein [Gammaproteobacteria bacterium]